LIHHSTYFQQLLPGKTSRPVSLVDEDAEIFEIISYWMYTSRFWALNTNKDGKIPFDLETILDMYFFALNKGMEALQNAAMTLLYQKTTQAWQLPRDLSRIYAMTLPTDVLRKFMVDHMADTWGCENLEKIQSYMTKELPSLTSCSCSRASTSPGYEEQ
jgi:UDP-galactopyranose mutase